VTNNNNNNKQHDRGRKGASMMDVIDSGAYIGPDSGQVLRPSARVHVGCPLYQRQFAQSRRDSFQCRCAHASTPCRLTDLALFCFFEHQCCKTGETTLQDYVISSNCTMTIMPKPDPDQHRSPRQQLRHGQPIPIHHPPACYPRPPGWDDATRNASRPGA